jgi:hypothetical protein
MRFKLFYENNPEKGLFSDTSNHNLKLKLTSNEYLYLRNKDHLKPLDDIANNIVNNSKDNKPEDE